MNTHSTAFKIIGLLFLIGFPIWFVLLGAGNNFLSEFFTGNLLGLIPFIGGLVWPAFLVFYIKEY